MSSLSSSRTSSRNRILAVVARRPGIHMKALAREVRLSSYGVAHHVNKLEAEGRLRTVRVGKARHVYLPEQTPERVLPVEAMNPTMRAILAVVEERPGIHLMELARVLERSLNAMRYNVERLEAGGFVRTRRVARQRRVYLAKRGASAGRK